MNRQKLEEIKEKHDLSLIILHGSQVTGTTHAQSDIDIAVTRKNGRPVQSLALIRELAEAFNTDRIDLSDLTHADPLFLYLATRTSKLLSGSKKDYDNLLKLAFHKYNDFQPYLKMEEDFVKKRIKSYVTS